MANPSKPKQSSKPKALSRALKKKPKIKPPRTAEQFTALPDPMQEQWTKIARTIQKMRREKISVSKAAREMGIPRKKVVELGGSALLKEANGRYTAKHFDRLLRVLVIPSQYGRSEIAVRDSRTASKIAEYSEAVRRFVQTGDASRLHGFKKVKLKDASGNPIKLLTDTKDLTRLGYAGVLSFESLYARVA